MYVYIHACTFGLDKETMMHVRMYLCMCMYLRIHACIYVCINLCMYVCIHVLLVSLHS